jgi:hypothetical protein
VADPDFAPFGNELAFVSAQYRDFLRRNVDPGGANLWINELWNGRSALDVTHQIYSSPEADAKVGMPIRLYYTAFDRHPDNGAKNWLGRTGFQVAKGLLESPEGTAKLPTNPEAFVRKTIDNSLGRPATQNEVTLWATRVRDVGRIQTLLEISEHPKHKDARYAYTQFAKAYLAMLNRAPVYGAGARDWIGAIAYARGYAERDLIAMIRGSAEYRNRPPR